MPDTTTNGGRPRGRPIATLRRWGAVAVLIATVAAAGAVGATQRTSAATQSPDGAEASRAFAAALRVFDAVPQADCASNNPRRRPCIENARGFDVAPERGVAVLSVNEPGGLGGGLAIMGRTAAGEWDLWFGTQNPSYRLFELPGAMLVCADGEGANLRQGWGTDRPVLAVLPDLTPVTVDAFVLTEPGSVNPLRVGAGWYNISAPEQGWIFSTLLSDARYATCALRDAAVRAEGQQPAAQPTPGQTVTVRLGAAGSGVTGTATLVAEGGATRVSLVVDGLTPGAGYVARLHSGSCAAPSASFAALPALQADAKGRATAAGFVRFRETMDVALADLADGDHVIVIARDGETVACASIPALRPPGGAPPSDLPGVAAVIRAVEARDADALASLVRYTALPCIATPQGIGAPPLCSAAGVAPGSLVDALPALLCEAEYFLRAVVPQFLRQQLERGGFVAYGVLSTDAAPYTFPLEVPAAGEWPAPEYAVIVRGTTSALDLGFYMAGGQVVALRSFSGEFDICGPSLPPADDPAWLVPPSA